MFGFFPSYVSTNLQWVFQDFSANGWYSSYPTTYNSEKKNGFAFKTGNAAYAYHCDDVWLGLFHEEYAYVLRWAGAIYADDAAMATAGINFFSSLPGWTAADMSVTDHKDLLGTECDYPVQILIGNEPKPINWDI